jgi:hypothetical protein
MRYSHGFKSETCVPARRDDHAFRNAVWTASSARASGRNWRHQRYSGRR